MIRASFADSNLNLNSRGTKAISRPTPHHQKQQNQEEPKCKSPGSPPGFLRGIFHSRDRGKDLFVVQISCCVWKWFPFDAHLPDSC
jgi:hypothetical protein